MGSTETPVPLEFNFTTLNAVLQKSLPKPMVPPAISMAEADDIIQGHDIEITDESDTENATSSIYMMILIPIASIALLIALAAAARWRYRVSHTRPVNGKCQTLDNNNDIPKAEEGLRPTEESLPLKSRNISTSSSSSTVSRNILIEGSKPITVSMRIVSDNEEILKSSRSELYCEVNSKVSEQPVFEERKGSTSDSVTLKCEVLKENKTANLSSNKEKSKKETTKNVQFKQEIKQEDTHPQRPKTLQVMTVVDSNAAANTNNCAKGFPWTEQQWTPDADIIYEDIGSPENACEFQKEGKDRLFPLMAKKRFKMKPKGLLERRGSNVALTISLKNDDKTCSSPPPSSKSPKPLVYLRTATAKLDPVQLHIKAADAQRLQQEFWEVPMNHPSEKHFSIPGYGTKNRYRSILPNPHSRVLLPVTPGGDPLSAYINANYVRGYTGMSEAERRRQSEDGKENDARRMSMRRKAGFIATQGPMANTIVDFWKMVWREKSTAIVMITKLKERKEKCAEYLPVAMGEKRTYGDFELEVKNVRFADHYTVRTIEVRNSEEDDEEVHTVTHYWYTEWLDHETPDKLRSLLTLVQEVDLRCPDMPNTDHGPVVAHCSAGIGRTGCFIAISIGCRQLRVEGKVDPLRIICQLRMDRGGMIQTWEQYQYVHVALSRYARILAGENVNTPLTGSSRTPDSWGSRHTTPNSGDFKSPLSSSRLFSPRLYPKLDLATVEEAESGTNDNEQKPGSRSAELDASVFSPRPTKVAQKLHFSFSCSDESKAPTNPTSEINPSSEESKPGNLEDTPQEVMTSKRTKKGPPPQLTLKMNSQPTPVRDENWLVNGHCTVPENDVKIDTDSENAERLTPRSPKQDDIPGNDCSKDTLDNEDLGKLRNILSPTSKDCQTPKKQQKSSVFMFPTPGK